MSSPAQYLKHSRSMLYPFTVEGCRCLFSLSTSGVISGCHWECGNPSSQRAVQFSSVTQSCLTPCDPMDCSMPGLPVHHQCPEFTQTHVRWVGDTSKHLILCRPLLLPPSIFLSIRVFSNESVLPIRWPNYWSFSFNSSPSNEYSGLISFRRDWLDLLAEPKSRLAGVEPGVECECLVGHFW